MQTNVPLKDYTTMRLGGPARVLATATSKEELVSFVSQATEQSQPILILGEGSNIIVGDQGFAGIVILNRIMGFETLHEDDQAVTIKIGAGENWDSAVGRTVDMNLSGIENLSSIPGRTGAAPIQNIGAYGQEIADTLTELEAYDLLQKKFIILKNVECDFAYRHSIFNSTARRRYIVASITLKLVRHSLEPPFYDSLQKYLDQHNITDYSPASLRSAVAAIRAIRLPDPKVVPSCGSFFKNPLVEKWQADSLRDTYDSPPLFDMGDNLYKISAGWLIEQAGLKGYASDGMKVYDKNALILINESATSYVQLAAMREHIIETVRDMFRVNLTQEPEEVGV
jgi:UDP-N-acetylmuramate dehydrogenase